MGDTPRDGSPDEPLRSPGPEGTDDRGRVLLRIALALMGAVLIAGIAWLGSYQPLTAGNTAEIPGDLAEEFFRGREEIAVDYEHGKTHTYAFTVQNTGPLPTTVLKVVPPRAGLLHPEEVRTSPADNPLSLDPDTAVPFEPFRLGVGEERGIVVMARFLRCDRYEGGGGIRRIGEELSVRTFVLTRTASIRFPRTIRVGSPGTGTGLRPSCPVVGPDVAVPAERPSDSPLDLEASLLATPDDAEIWLTSLDRRPWSRCRGTIETDGAPYAADVGRIDPLETRSLPTSDFRAEGRAFRSRRTRAVRIGLSCSVGGDKVSGRVRLRPYEPRELDALRFGGFEYRQERQPPD